MTPSPQPEVFTSAFKIRGNILSAGVTLLAAFGPIALGAVGAGVVGKAYGDAYGGLLFLLSFALVFVLLHVCHQKAFMFGNARLRRDLAAALERRLGRNPDDGTAYFVGWAPGRSANPAGGDTDHDVGFLTLKPESMLYIGDTVSFELPRQQVRYIEASQEGVPVLLDMGVRVRVYWWDQNGQENAFTLERREGRNRTVVKRKNKELEGILRQWHQPGSAPA